MEAATAAIIPSSPLQQPQLQRLPQQKASLPSATKIAPSLIGESSDNSALRHDDEDKDGGSSAKISGGSFTDDFREMDPTKMKPEAEATSTGQACPITSTNSSFPSPQLDHMIFSTPVLPVWLYQFYRQQYYNQFYHQIGNKNGFIDYSENPIVASTTADEFLPHIMASTPSPQQANINNSSYMYPIAAAPPPLPPPPHIYVEPSPLIYSEPALPTACAASSSTTGPSANASASGCTNSNALYTFPVTTRTTNNQKSSKASKSTKSAGTKNAKEKTKKKDIIKMSQQTSFVSAKKHQMNDTNVSSVQQHQSEHLQSLQTSYPLTGDGGYDIDEAGAVASGSFGFVAAHAPVSSHLSVPLPAQSSSLSSSSSSSTSSSKTPIPSPTADATVVNALTDSTEREDEDDGRASTSNNDDGSSSIHEDDEQNDDENQNKEKWRPHQQPYRMHYSELAIPELYNFLDLMATYAAPIPPPPPQPIPLPPPPTSTTETITISALQQHKKQQQRQGMVVTQTTTKQTWWPPTLTTNTDPTNAGPLIVMTAATPTINTRGDSVAAASRSCGDGAPKKKGKKKKKTITICEENNISKDRKGANRLGKNVPRNNRKKKEEDESGLYGEKQRKEGEIATMSCRQLGTRQYNYDHDEENNNNQSQPSSSAPSPFPSHQYSAPFSDPQPQSPFFPFLSTSQQQPLLLALPPSRPAPKATTMTKKASTTSETPKIVQTAVPSTTTGTTSANLTPTTSSAGDDGAGEMAADREGDQPHHMRQQNEGGEYDQSRRRYHTTSGGSCSKSNTQGTVPSAMAAMQIGISEGGTAAGAPQTITKTTKENRTTSGIRRTATPRPFSRPVLASASFNSRASVASSSTAGAGGADPAGLARRRRNNRQHWAGAPVPYVGESVSSSLLTASAAGTARSVNENDGRNNKTTAAPQQQQKRLMMTTQPRRVAAVGLGAGPGGRPTRSSSLSRPVFPSLSFSFRGSSTSRRQPSHHQHSFAPATVGTASAFSSSVSSSSHRPHGGPLAPPSSHHPYHHLQQQQQLIGSESQPSIATTITTAFGGPAGGGPGGATSGSVYISNKQQSFSVAEIRDQHIQIQKRYRPSRRRHFTDPVDFEGILNIIGGCSWWQIWVYLLISLQQIPHAMFNLSVVYMMYQPDHWCQVPGLNNTDAVAKSSAKNSSKNANWFSWTIEETLPTSIVYPRTRNTQREDPNFHSQCHYYDRGAERYSELGRMTLDEAEQAVKLDTNVSIVKCSKWYYEQDTMKQTIVTEWNLVCDDNFKRAHAHLFYSLGFLLGCLLGGYSSDRFGRKPTVLGFGVLSSMFGLILPYSTYFPMFLFIRFCGAVCNEAADLAAYVLCMEITGTRYRAMVGSLLQAPWAVGYATLALIAYFCKSWQHIQLITAALHTVAICLICVLPESPRWLIVNNRVDEAERYIRRACRDPPLPFSLFKFNKSSLPCDLELVKHAEQRKWVRRDQRANILHLLKSRALCMRTGVVCIVWIATALVYYGLVIALSDQSAPGRVLFSGNFFVNNAIAGAIELPTLLSCVYLMRFGRKSSQMFTLMAAAVFIFCAMAAMTARSQMTALGLMLISKIFIQGAFNILYIFTSELYPTVIRNSAVGFCSMVARFGSGVSSYIAILSDVTLSIVPMLIFAVFSLFACTLVLLLPETRDQPLPDTLQDAVTFLKSSGNAYECIGGLASRLGADGGAATGPKSSISTVVGPAAAGGGCGGPDASADATMTTAADGSGDGPGDYFGDEMGAYVDGLIEEDSNRIIEEDEDEEEEEEDEDDEEEDEDDEETKEGNEAGNVRSENGSAGASTHAPGNGTANEQLSFEDWYNRHYYGAGTGVVYCSSDTGTRVVAGTEEAAASTGRFGCATLSMLTAPQRPSPPATTTTLDDPGSGIWSSDGAAIGPQQQQRFPRAGDLGTGGVPAAVPSSPFYCNCAYCFCCRSAAAQYQYYQPEQRQKQCSFPPQYYPYYCPFYNGTTAAPAAAAAAAATSSNNSNNKTPGPPSVASMAVGARPGPALGADCPPRLVAKAQPEATVELGAVDGRGTETPSTRAAHSTPSPAAGAAVIAIGGAIADGNACIGPTTTTTTSSTSGANSPVACANALRTSTTSPATSDRNVEKVGGALPVTTNKNSPNNSGAIQAAITDNNNNNGDDDGPSFPFPPMAAAILFGGGGIDTRPPLVE